LFDRARGRCRGSASASFHRWRATAACNCIITISYTNQHQHRPHQQHPSHPGPGLIKESPNIKHRHYRTIKRIDCNRLLDTSEDRSIPDYATHLPHSTLITNCLGYLRTLFDYLDVRIHLAAQVDQDDQLSRKRSKSHRKSKPL
jgi:hypothetical protein